MPYFDWNGHQIFYREQGKGPLLLILPGNTASSKWHQVELDYFSNRYRVSSIDFLGTGKSDRLAIWAEDWWAQGASQAEALLKYLGYEDCIVMGTSGGAAVALLMAIHFPEKVRAIIADSCVERFSKEMAHRNVYQERKQRMPDQVKFWKYAHGADWEQVIEADTAMLLRFADQGGDWFAGRLSEIKCPVILTASKQDEALPQVAQQLGRMYEQIADCRVFLNNRGGHPLMWSAPQDFRYISDYFLKAIGE
jgi:valacyclovir hydrolase